jgi:putative endonuclease
MWDADSFGRRSEEAAAEFLVGRGYRILERNFRTRLGEIDMVASDGDTLVFIEVKARRTVLFGGSHNAVDRRKMRRLSKLARQYLSYHRLHDRPCRFDLVLIEAPGGGPPVLELMKNAFEVEGDFS